MMVMYVYRDNLSVAYNLKGLLSAYGWFQSRFVVSRLSKKHFKRLRESCQRLARFPHYMYMRKTMYLESNSRVQI